MTATTTPPAEARAGLRRDAGRASFTGLLASLAALHLVVLVPQLSPVRAAVALPVLLVLPGLLVLHALGGRWYGWSALVRAVPMSLAVLMACGLVPALLPGPALSTGACLAAVDVAVALLALAVRRRGRPPGPLPPLRIRFTGSGPAGVLAGGGAVALAVAGAAQLNTGGSPVAAMAGLACAVVAFAGAVVTAHRRRTGTAATVIYLVALAVLLATSLRGTVVTGHDVKIEYRVLMDTLAAGSWQPGGPYPGYNSCLSLTVLPAMLAKLLGIAALDVFRICFQLVFALVPVATYLLARRLLRPAYAVLVAGLFVAFPTFVNDMPMLNRQEIALLFFTVGLLTLLDQRAPAGRRSALLLILAAGLTVSHYSSAGVCAAMLSLAWLAHRLRRLWRQPAAPAVHPSPGAAATTMILLVLGWSALTGSAAAFATDIAATARAALSGAEVRSAASGYRPGADASAGDVEALHAYLADLTADRAEVGARPAPGAAAPVVLPADELPRTAAGELLDDAGLEPGVVNEAVRWAVVALFEGGAVAGCVLLWLRPRRPAARTLAEWSLAGVLLLGVAVAVPQITDSYGLLRLYQQLLPVLGIAVVSALLAAGRLSRRPRWTGPIAAGLVTATLITTSGLLPRATGGYPPQLNLADAGPYRRAYLAGAGDLAVAETVRTRVPGGAWVVADSRDALNLRALAAGPLAEEGLAAGTVPDDAYVLVALARPGQALAVAVVGDRVIRYTFPITDVARGRRVAATTNGHILYAPYGR